MTTLTPLEMIRIWRQGCSVSEKHTAPEDDCQPELCPECTRGLIDAIELWLRLPLWKRVWLNSRGYDFLRRFLAWKLNKHRS